MCQKRGIVFRIKIVMAAACFAFLPSVPVVAGEAPASQAVPADMHWGYVDSGWNGLFGRMSVRTNRIAGHERWNSMLKRAEAGCGRSCPPAWNDWTSLVGRLDGISRYAQVKSVNWAANAALAWRSDVSAFGKPDYWASPAEALTRGGDCEDFVAMKYLALRAAGFAERDLRIVVVQDTKRGVPHAVLVALVNGARYVLDNQSDDVASDLEMTRYRPLYSFNGTGKWIHLDLRKREAVAMVD